MPHASCLIPDANFCPPPPPCRPAHASSHVRDPRTLTPLAYHSLRARQEETEETDGHDKTDGNDSSKPSQKPWLVVQSAALPEQGRHDEQLSQGPLWSAARRHGAPQPDSELHSRRHRALFTSFECDAGEQEKRAQGTHTHTHTHTSTCFPVLLVRVERGAGMSKTHARGRKDHAAGVLSGVSGWDLVLPRQWALPVWHALIKCGCRALALRESQVFNPCRYPALDTS
jgi:hypothetical protein